MDEDEEMAELRAQEAKRVRDEAKKCLRHASFQLGKSGEIVWQFTKAGKVNFACLQPGHYDAGMKGAVSVAGGKK